MTSNPASEHAQFNIGVKALIVKDGRLLFLKRQDHHKWELPGGRIEKDEAIADTLRRELLEELPQLKHCKIRGIIHAQPADFQLPNGNNLMLLFFRVAAHLPELLTSSEEHQEARWVSASELGSLKLQQPFMQAAEAVLRTSDC